MSGGDPTVAIDIESTPWRKTWTRARAWALRVLEFASVQAVVQVLGAVAGLLIVRVLPKHDYALFGIANSMQTACQVLAELGTGIGFQSIAGRVYDDRQRLGALLNATLRLRRQFAVLSFAVCVPVTGWLLAKNGASEPMLVGLCAVLLAGAAPLVPSTVLVMVPQLHGEYRKIQALHLGSASLRCLLIAGLA
ncbi:MAG: hypothetical protein ACREMV_15875, partial [Gemmatimonadales bacterium]